MDKVLIQYEQINPQMLSQLLKSAFIKVNSIDGNLVHYVVDDVNMSVGHNEPEQILHFSKLIPFGSKFSESLIREIIVNLNGYFNVVFYIAASDNTGLVLVHPINTESGISRGNLIVCAKRFATYYEATIDKLSTQYGITI